MKLHEDKTLFMQLLNFSANSLNIRPEFIEKDYWLTRALQRMAQNPNAEKVVFKGGTSLSKAYRLTNRFSEDVDIAVIDADSFSGKVIVPLSSRAKEIINKYKGAGKDNLIMPFIHPNDYNSELKKVFRVKKLTVTMIR